jgi:hypothetical protein
VKNKKQFMLMLCAGAFLCAAAFYSCDNPTLDKLWADNGNKNLDPPPYTPPPPDPPPDTTAPRLSNGTVSDLVSATGSTARLGFDTDEAGTYYYLVLDSSSTAPDADAVKAQGRAAAEGSGSAAINTNSISTAGLVAGKDYTANIVETDAANNLSNMLTVAGVNPLLDSLSMVYDCADSADGHSSSFSDLQTFISTHAAAAAATGAANPGTLKILNMGTITAAMMGTIVSAMTDNKTYLNIDISDSSNNFAGNTVVPWVMNLEGKIYIKGIALPDSVTSIGVGAFSYASLTSLSMGNNVTSIGRSAFGDCHSLTSIRLSSSLQSIGMMAFSHCSMTNITLPATVTSIAGSAFGYCDNLTSVTFSPGIALNSANFASYETFPGDLRAKYLAEGAGTYTRPSGGSVWTKQP